MKRNKKWIFGICVILCLCASVSGGYIFKRLSYVEVKETELPFKFLRGSSYSIYNVDLSDIIIDQPMLSGHHVVLKIKCVDDSFNLRNTPVILQLFTNSNRMMAEKQYQLTHKRNKIVLDAQTLPQDSFLMRVGYFTYSEFYRNDYRFKCTSFSFRKINDEYQITRYTIDDPQVVNGRLIVKQIVKEIPVSNYVYQYDIDFDFNGFKDNKNNLISDKKVNITLKNGSRYSGSIKNGYFEGDGEFHDVILRRTLKGSFKHGVIETEDSIDNHTFKLTIDRPMLSKSYPIGGSYKTEYIFIDSLNRERIDYIYSESITKGIILYQQVFTFDANGNMTKREWKGFDGYYMDDGPFALGLTKTGESKTIGVAKVEYTFDSDHNVISEKYFDSKDGLLRNGSIGQKTVLMKPLKIK